LFNVFICTFIQSVMYYALLDLKGQIVRTVGPVLNGVAQARSGGRIYI